MSELAMLNDQKKRLEVMERTDRSYFYLRAVAALMGIPVHRALWPMAPVDYQRPECGDIGPWGYHLQSANALGDVEFSYDTANIFAPIAIFSGAVNSYLLRADGGAGNWADILGTEVQVRAAQRGLALGGWFQASLVGAGQALMGKDDGGANRQYLLFVNPAPGNTARFQVFPGPIGVSSAAAIVSGWNHVTGIYDQTSQTIFIELNGVITAGVAGAAPAALADTAAPFTIGADGAGTTRLTGVASMGFLSACATPFVVIQGLRQEQRNVFGV